jgi:hypothetical protein
LLIDKFTKKDIHKCIGDIGREESTISTPLDLTSGLWQMPVFSGSAPKTAFTLTCHVKFKWLMSPMGYIGCPASFERLIEKLMEKIDNVIVHIDILLIHSQTHS